ncbi:hypothetical protein K432DRAFT_112426 [Lepidopterella palustris CBS 459.81]|uniref:DNA-directed RNA polymerase III subunit RPC3 n=1 Tax=Lepidopterella palustris CBS 459.81 TaxID=1314670 RepID=A0A8E2EIT4_9PEZI|nr:hypothetical protein K432DRAFT_112426 [Lepidopterella palustris CBS 459.81]
MSQYLSELCTLLIDDLYGELSSQVFSTLARVGRQPLSGLLRYSNLSARHFKHGLVVLIQQHLALHYTSDTDGLTYFEANWEHAYNLVRYGKIEEMVQDRYGEQAAGIISNLLLLGHTKVSDLTEAYGVANNKSNLETGTNRVNGDGLSRGTGVIDVDDFSNGDELRNGAGSSSATKKPENHFRSRGQLHTLLYKLLSVGWIVPVRASHFWPQADLHNEAAAFVISSSFENKIPKGPRKVKEYAQKLNKQKRKDRDDALELPHNSAVIGTKRPTMSTAFQPRKRIRLNGVNGTNGHSDLGDTQDDDVSLDGEIVVRVNHEKISVAIRTEQLTLLASRYLGQTTSLVYRTLLRLLEERIPRCFENFPVENEDGELIEDPPVIVTSQEVAKVIDTNIDLADGLQQDITTNGINGDAHDEFEDLDGAHLNGHASDNLGTRTRMVDQHLRLLCEDPRKFAHWMGSRGTSEWKVEFASLAETLIQNEIEKTVTARHDRMGARLIRVLHSKGKLDEKQVSTFSMTPPKTIRSILTSMQESGYVETQEVPKDASRQPSRTMYFWFYDQERCRQLLLTDTYKAMARILQRIKVERETVQAVIDKAERTDVIGHEDEYLSKTERDVLRQWSQTEEKLLLQLSRQDDLVTILKDFIGPL